MTALGALVAHRPTKAPAAAAVAIAIVLALLSSVAAAGAQGVELNDIEDEVMCPICGTLLQLAESPQAQRQRAFVRRQIAAGRSKEEIKRALVAQYGEEVLALPDDSGFDLSAYVVPVLAFLAAVVALAVGVARWRRASPAAPESPPRRPEGEDAERLEADIARYDL